MSDRMLDRRADVGQKMFIGIITAVLTTIFVGALGISLRSMEKGHDLELRVVKLEVFIVNQDKLNDKLSKLLDRVDSREFVK